MLRKIRDGFKDNWDIVLVLIIFGALAWSCTAPSPTSPDKGNTSQSVTQIVSVGGASPSPGAVASCAGVNKVVESAISSFTHGGSSPLGFTSFDAQGSPRSRACDQASTETWSVLEGTCVVDRPHAVSPNLTASSAGSCRVNIDVDGVDDSASVTVQ